MKYYIFLLVILLFYNQELTGQIKYDLDTQKCIRSFFYKSSPDSLLIYTIKNKAKQNLLIFFIEESNDTLSPVKLLKRKLYRRYGDFSLSMVEWEANMSIEINDSVIPKLFVKVLEPEEIFKIVVPFADYQDEQIALKVTQHLLMCSESDFSSNIIEMPHFIENLQKYDIIYPGTTLVISISTFKSFICDMKKEKKQHGKKNNKKGRWPDGAHLHV